MTLVFFIDSGPRWGFSGRGLSKKGDRVVLIGRDLRPAEMVDTGWTTSGLGSVVMRPGMKLWGSNEAYVQGSLISD